MPDITAPTREEALVPAPAKARSSNKRRFGVMTFGVIGALGSGLAGGANLHRIVDLDQTATWLQQTGSSLQSGFMAARTEIGSRISGLSSVAGAGEPMGGRSRTATALLNER